MCSIIGLSHWNHVALSYRGECSYTRGQLINSLLEVTCATNLHTVTHAQTIPEVEDAIGESQAGRQAEQ